MKTPARFAPDLNLSPVEHERRSGRGQFAERRALLDLTLNRLVRHGRTDLDRESRLEISASPLRRYCGQIR